MNHAESDDNTASDAHGYACAHAREQWRTCLRDDRYEVSSLGRVRCGDKIQRQYPYGWKKKYRQAYVGKGGTTAVHTLVLEAFKGPRPEDKVCRHLNGKHADNRIENLAWGTRSENVRDSIRHGTYVNPKSGPNVWSPSRLPDTSSPEWIAYIAGEH